MVQERSAGAVIFRKEDGKVKYLTLHYKSGHWGFVKGHVEKGETDQITVIRETEEETGIKDLKIIAGFKHPIHYFFQRKKTTVSKDVMFYVAETKTKEVTLSYEHKGYDWLTYDEAIEKVTFKNAKDVLEKANSFLQNIKNN